MKIRNFLIIIILLAAVSLSCSNSQKKNRLVFEEKAGISRTLEYVKIKLSNHYEQRVILKELLTGNLIFGEKLNNETSVKDSSTYIFPISINAYEKKTYIIANTNAEFEPVGFEVTKKEKFLKIENEYFIADFNITNPKLVKEIHHGNLSSLYIKNHKVLLQRDRISMHWSPSFKKEEFDYKTFSHSDSKNLKITQKNSYTFEMTKYGHVHNYEEIDLFGQYNFFAGLPYFEYTSTMTINKEIALTLLRNDEMTMNNLFTHLIYPDSLGKLTTMPLYNKVKFDSLKKAPLADDIGWFGFINDTLNYGFVSIRLAYNNQNINGSESPLYKQHTKISAGQNNGRYWNRRLIHDHKTVVPKGSKYYEKNAYLVLEDLNNLSNQINYYSRCLKNPIEAYYLLE